MAKKNLTLEDKLEEAIVKEWPYEVPGNWGWVKLKSVILDTVSGFACSKRFEMSPNEIDAYPHLRPNNIGYFGKINLDKVVYIPKEKVDDKKNKLIKGELLFNNTNSTELVGRSIIINEDIDVAFSNHITKISVNEDICKAKFLNYAINYNWCQGIFAKLCKQWVGQSGINQDVLKDEIEIPLPPLKEQQRIVDRIESLFEKLDKAKELIEEAREGFEKRKSAVLVKALTGVLTEKWRKNNDISNSKLLDKIIGENKKVKKNFALSYPEELYDIPNDWSWIKLKDICEKFKYGTSAKSQIEGKIPVLRMGNLQKRTILWDNLVYTNDEDEINKYDLTKGDLLFNRTNSPELVGKTSIYDGEIKAIFAGYLIRVRTLSGINSKYVNYFMNSIYAKTRCMEVKSDGVSQSNINAEKLGDFDIPLPSSEEQNEIVKILDKLLEEESKIEEFTQLEEQIELIKKSILAKAFRGELGTNSEEDESALELLKEILSKE